MKNLIIYFIAAVMFLSACDPIEKREELGARLSPSELNITVQSSSQGSNGIIVSNNTPGVSGTWFYTGGGYSFKQKDTIALPYPGEHTIIFRATTDGGIVEKSVKVQVAKLDYYVPGYSELTNGDTKTWVYDDAYENGYCYMTANYDWEEFWWNPYEDDPTPDFGAKMKFDLEGGSLNYTLIEADGTETKGSFVLNMNDMTLQIIDSHIPDQNEENCDPDVTATGIYEIKILEDGQLLLWQDQSAINPDDYDYGWAWVFKPE